MDLNQLQQISQGLLEGSTLKSKKETNRNIKPVKLEKELQADRNGDKKGILYLK